MPESGDQSSLRLTFSMRNTKPWIILLLMILTLYSTAFALIPATEAASTQNYIVAEYGAGTLDKITTGGSLSVVTSGLVDPFGVAVDSSGNYIVTESGAGTLDKITTGGSLSVVTSGLVGPFGVAVDSSGNYIVTEYGAGRLDKITTGGSLSVIRTGLSYPIGVAIPSGPPGVPVVKSGKFMVTVHHNLGGPSATVYQLQVAACIGCGNQVTIYKLDFSFYPLGPPNFPSGTIVTVAGNLEGTTIHVTSIHK